MNNRQPIFHGIREFFRPSTQPSLFHYFREEKCPFKWKVLLQDLVLSFRSPVFIPSVFNAPYDAILGNAHRRVRRVEAGLFSVMLHASIILLAVLMIRPAALPVSMKETRVILTTPFLIPSDFYGSEGGGGGGGGRGEKESPAWGRMPDGARLQLVPPDPVEPHPLVPAEELTAPQATDVMPFEIPHDPSFPIGDITAPFSSSRSSGPGGGSGIGTGDGPGKGPGFGPGEKGGMGNGTKGTIGSEGDGVYGPGAAGLKYPVILSEPKPEYTEDARKTRTEGIVLIQAVVRRDGSVDSFRVIRGLGHGLDESAIQTIAKKWRFRPGTIDGVPVDVLANIEISFRLF